MEALFTFVALILGIATCVLSVFVAFVFWLKTRHLVNDSLMLTSALKWQLIGEAIIGLGTLVFAIAAYTGALNSWPSELSSAVRMLMFLATSVTTLHLYRVVRRLQLG